MRSDTFAVSVNERTNADVIDVLSVSVIDSTSARGKTREAETDGVNVPDAVRVRTKDPTRDTLSVLVAVSVKLMVESGASISTEMSDQFCPAVIP